MSDSEEYEYEYDESDQVSGSLPVGDLAAARYSFSMLLVVGCTELLITQQQQEQMDADTAEEESFQYTGGLKRCPAAAFVTFVFTHVHGYSTNCHRR